MLHTTRLWSLCHSPSHYRKENNLFCSSVRFFKEFLGEISQEKIPSINQLEKPDIFFRKTPFILSSIIHSSPIPNTLVFYINGSSSGNSGITSPTLTTTLSRNCKFAQQLETAMMIHLFSHVWGSCNVASDSAYVVGLFPVFLNAYPYGSGITSVNTNPLITMFEPILSLI